jgi:hemerythrin-like domain-containing protein
MTDCHRRVEKFLLVLARAGELQGRLLSNEERDALETALRYFREAAPKHTEDEERSLFPRLRNLEFLGIGTVLALLDDLERDHSFAQSWHQELDELGRRWLAAGSLPAAEAVRFQDLARELVRLYQDHIHIEEQRVFPVAAERLPPGELRVIGEEMAARRGLR